MVRLRDIDLSETLRTTERRCGKEIDPAMLQLSELFVDVLSRRFTTTAFCIDLAKSAFGWELAGKPDKARKIVKAAIRKAEE